MCDLTPGPPPSDASGAVGATPTVCVTSSDSPAMTIVSAAFNGQVLPVNDGTVVLPGLLPGNNVLNLIVEPGKTGDEAVLNEVCEGKLEPLAAKFLGGGGNGHVGFTIHGR